MEWAHSGAERTGEPEDLQRTMPELAVRPHRIPLCRVVPKLQWQVRFVNRRNHLAEVGWV